MIQQLRSIALCIAALVGSHAHAQFTMNDIQFWVGTGSDSAVLVVDFQDSTATSSYAWGYLFNGTATGEDMLNAVAAADPHFTVNNTGGFLNDITYMAHAGIGGTGGFWWSTWTGTSMATLASNLGISEVLSNGEWFGCSFTDFNPAVVPGEPIAAPVPTGVAEVLSGEGVALYPNPASNAINLDFTPIYGQNNHLQMVDAQGRVVWEVRNAAPVVRLAVDHLPAGVYSLLISSEDYLRQVRFVKQ